MHPKPIKFSIAWRQLRKQLKSLSVDPVSVESLLREALLLHAHTLLVMIDGGTTLSNHGKGRELCYRSLNPTSDCLHEEIYEAAELV